MVDLNLDEEYISYHEKYTICNLSESESDSDSESFIIEALDSSNE